MIVRVNEADFETHLRNTIRQSELQVLNSDKLLTILTFVHFNLANLFLRQEIIVFSQAETRELNIIIPYEIKENLHR